MRPQTLQLQPFCICAAHSSSRASACAKAADACRVAVLNDFEANGYGILALKPQDVIVLHDAQPQPKVRQQAALERSFIQHQC